MAWKRLILVRNETKNFFSRQRPVQVRLRGVPVTADWAPAPWLRDHSESHFFGDTLYLARGSCLNRPERERPDVAVDRAVRGGVGARGRGGHRAEHLATQPVNTGAWPVGKVSRCQVKVWQDLASSRPPALSCPRCSWWRTGLPPSPSCISHLENVRACENVRCGLKVFCRSLWQLARRLLPNLPRSLWSSQTGCAPAYCGSQLRTLNLFVYSQV